MHANNRREAALQLLADTGMHPGIYAPPLFRLMWFMGIDVPPPHFMPTWAIAAFSGAFFAIGWGTVMWSVLWSHDGMSVTLAIGVALGAGVFFGIVMSRAYIYGRRKYGLPLWRELIQGKCPK